MACRMLLLWGLASLALSLPRHLLQSMLTLSKSESAARLCCSLVLLQRFCSMLYPLRHVHLLTQCQLLLAIGRSVTSGVQVSRHRGAGARGREHHLRVRQWLPMGGGTEQLPTK